MTSRYSTFVSLHEGSTLLLLPNAWDAASAQVLERQGYRAIATSSAAVAQSLGYADGEDMPFTDYLFVIRRIAAATPLPLTVDLEMGYGRTADAIFANVAALATLGVVGINLEDSQVTADGRVLQDAQVFAEKLGLLRDKLLAAQIDLFINVRCDTYFLDVSDKQAATLRRAALYAAAGADGLFLPGIRAAADIAVVVDHCPLPINVMALPGLADVRTLQELGVKRVSMGPFLFEQVYRELGLLSEQIRQRVDVQVLFGETV
ncbi:isocitrate lyase/phosphoenolpyruvate mutase family protein [Chitinophaga pendula]|uniref:isocitrate lyase/PEP mutase family protein n=1 Tax=Chitinophaga TaxID=79328 RepID=UPI000BAFB2FD|nr:MULTISPECIES: isocitrate lyase/phosphoenolpyruvate mutase family protein [Chitinophaga]ASZ12641.1 carboxyvinyl-carboxyphosphonate phosphorylmutase [Chitinophaga sp. MD30]UCJ09749.1 isocitrate lyase/phosphoenolpyruvate mutase family protein [Chitinophaga pendula]